jgi:hypothetical protein
LAASKALVGCRARRCGWHHQDFMRTTTVDSRKKCITAVLFCAAVRSSLWMARSIRIEADVVCRQNHHTFQQGAGTTRCFSPPESFRPRSPTMVP